jgi:hypothetical protein
MAMAGDAVRSLTLAQAVARQERMTLPLCPATLHPLYVEADAARNTALQPAYLCFEDRGECWMHAVHVSRVPGTSLRDASSPYGYGGPLSTSDDPRFLAAAWRAYSRWMLDERIVVEYVRFHPVLGNDRHYGGRVADNRQVVSVDLTVDDIASNYASRLRYTVKKAEKAGLVYEESDFGDHAAEFASYHRAAMREMQADAFYLFDDDYFERLGKSGLATLGVCRQQGGDAWLAAGLFLDGAGVREYHLAATNEGGRATGASSFTLHRAALAAKAQGRRHLYLGGGTDASVDNPLLFFKSSYSPQRLWYRTGSAVFDAAAYDELTRRFPAEWAAHPERPIFYRKV